MAEPGYKCQFCLRTFTEYHGCGSTETGELRCPTCGSRNVTKTELSEDWGYVPHGSACFG